MLPDGSRWEFGYDGLSRLRWVIDAVGGRAELSYDRDGNLTGSTDPTGVVQDFGYGPAGLPVRAADPVSEVGAGWDGLGRLVEQVDEDGSVTRYEYDPDERVSAVEHPGLGRAEIDRDELGRVTAVTAPGVRAEWTWRAGAVVAQRVERNGFVRTTRIERDSDGRVVAQTVDGVRTEFSYDAAGQLVRAVSGEGIVTVFVWDLNGRLVAQTSGGRRTEYGYDASGQLEQMRRPDGSRVWYTHDAAGRRTGERGEDGWSRVFDWDPQGFLERVTTITDAGGSAAVTELRADALGALAWVNGEQITWDEVWGGAPIQVGDVPIVDVGAGIGVGGPSGGWLLPDRAGHDAAAGLWDLGAEGFGGSSQSRV
ncbi:RHS repeat protein [Propionibacterium australiense]|uniref:RHS repeat protein n=1 Tax=Propionibacterium australiense TaxID=119981 RepID=A0A8B3FPM1_9ACTN|nr:RHS repeat protein [Propionibacterium australiense]